MFGDRGFGTDPEVTRDLRIRRLVSMLREKPGNVIEDFFLALSSRQHLLSLSKEPCEDLLNASNSSLASITRQAILVTGNICCDLASWRDSTNRCFDDCGGQLNVAISFRSVRWGSSITSNAFLL